MYVTSAPTAHVAHCSHHSQHWELVQLACERTDVRSIAIMTGGNIHTRKLQKLQRSKFLRILLCGEGKKVDATIASIRTPQVEVKKLCASTSSSRHTDPLPVAHLAISRCVFTLVIGLGVTGVPLFVILGNFRLASSKKAVTNSTYNDPLDRATYICMPEVAKTMFAVFSQYWTQGQDVISPTSQTPVCMSSVSVPSMHAGGTDAMGYGLLPNTTPRPTTRLKKIDHLVYIAQAILTNVSIGLSLGLLDSHSALLTGALKDPHILLVDIFLGSNVYTTDLFPLLATKTQVRVVRVNSFPSAHEGPGPTSVDFPPSWLIKYSPCEDMSRAKSVSDSNAKQQLGARKPYLHTSSMFLLTGKTGDGRAVFSLEGSMPRLDTNPPSRRGGPVASSMSSLLHQSALSYCLYLKSVDSLGIVESHARDFEDVFNLC